MSLAVDSFSCALGVLSRYPKILMPLLVPFVVHVVSAFTRLGFVGSALASLLSFISYAVMVQALAFAVEGKTVDVWAAWRKVSERLDDAIITSFLATLLALTVILIPAALYSIVVMVVDGEKPVKSIMKALSFIIDNLKEVIVILIVAIVVAVLAYILGAIIPLTGFILFYALSLVISGLVCLAMAILYFVRAKKVSLKVFY